MTAAARGSPARHLLQAVSFYMLHRNAIREMGTQASCRQRCAEADARSRLQAIVGMVETDRGSILLDGWPPDRDLAKATGGRPAPKK